MAVGLVAPRNVAGNLGTLATALAAKPAISAAVVVPTLGNVDVLRAHVKVTGTTVADVDAAFDDNVRIVNRGTSTGGTFTLTVDGIATTALAFGAVAATVKTALEVLATVTLATVTGAGTVGSPWVIYLDDTGVVRVVTGDGALLTGGDATLTVSTPVANVQILSGTTVA